MKLSRMAEAARLRAWGGFGRPPRLPGIFVSGLSVKADELWLAVTDENLGPGLAVLKTMFRSRPTSSMKLRDT